MDAIKTGCRLSKSYFDYAMEPTYAEARGIRGIRIRVHPIIDISTNSLQAEALSRKPTITLKLI